MTFFNLSASKVVKGEIEFVLPVSRFLRLSRLGKDDRSLEIGLGFGGAIEFGEGERSEITVPFIICGLTEILHLYN